MKSKHKTLSYDEIIKLELVPLKYIPSLFLNKGVAMSIGTLNRWIQDGKVEFTMVGGRAYFSQEQIARLMQKQIKVRNEGK
jgi:hypothetical protein